MMGGWMEWRIGGWRMYRMEDVVDGWGDGMEDG